MYVCVKRCREWRLTALSRFLHIESHLNYFRPLDRVSFFACELTGAWSTYLYHHHHHSHSHHHRHHNMHKYFVYCSQGLFPSTKITEWGWNCFQEELFPLVAAPHARNHCCMPCLSSFSLVGWWQHLAIKGRKYKVKVYKGSHICALFSERKNLLSVEHPAYKRNPKEPPTNPLCYLIVIMIKLRCQKMCLCKTRWKSWKLIRLFIRR